MCADASHDITCNINQRRNCDNSHNTHNILSAGMSGESLANTSSASILSIAPLTNNSEVTPTVVKSDMAPHFADPLVLIKDNLDNDSLHSENEM